MAYGLVIDILNKFINYSLMAYGYGLMTLNKVLWLMTNSLMAYGLWSYYVLNKLINYSLMAYGLWPMVLSLTY